MDIPFILAMQGPLRRLELARLYALCAGGLKRNGKRWRTKYCATESRRRAVERTEIGKFARELVNTDAEACAVAASLLLDDLKTEWL